MKKIVTSKPLRLETQTVRTLTVNLDKVTGGLVQQSKTNASGCTCPTGGCTVE